MGGAAHRRLRVPRSFLFLCPLFLNISIYLDFPLLFQTLVSLPRSLMVLQDALRCGARQAARPGEFLVEILTFFTFSFCFCHPPTH